MRLEHATITVSTANTAIIVIIIISSIATTIVLIARLGITRFPMAATTPRSSTGTAACLLACLLAMTMTAHELNLDC